MTIEITQEEIERVEDDFLVSNYESYSDRQLAMLQEIVMLRKKNDDLQEAVESLRERLDVACEEPAGEDW